MTHAILTKSRERGCYGVTLFSKTTFKTLRAPANFLPRIVNSSTQSGETFLRKVLRSVLEHMNLENAL